MDRMKRGVIATLSTLLLSIALLSFFSVIAKNHISISETAKILSDFESVNRQFDSVEQGLKTIMAGSGINATFDGANVSLSIETDRYANYAEGIGLFSNFIQLHNETGVSINASPSNPILLLERNNITINYSYGKTQVLAKQGPESSENINGYELLIKSDIPTPSESWAALSEVSEGNPNSLNFHLGLQGVNGTLSITKILDKYGQSQLQLLNQDSLPIITIYIDPPASIRIENNPEINLKIIIGLDNSDVVLRGANMINSSKSQYGEKAGVVKIYED